MVAALPPSQSAIDAVRARIPEETLRFRFSRSGGPGGQNVNKTNTRVTLLFDLTGCEALTTYEQRRIAEKLPGHVSNDGVLRVVSTKHRTQRANRDAAVERFYLLVARALHRPRPRKAAKVSAGARRRRLEDKRRRARTKQLRGHIGAD